MVYKIKLNGEKMQAAGSKPYAFMPLVPKYGPNGLEGVIPGLAWAGETVPWYGDPNEPPDIADPADPEAEAAYARKSQRVSIADDKARLAELEAERAALVAKLAGEQPAPSMLVDVKPVKRDGFAAARAAKAAKRSASLAAPSLSAGSKPAAEIHALPDMNAEPIVPVM